MRPSWPQASLRAKSDHGRFWSADNINWRDRCRKFDQFGVAARVAASPQRSRWTAVGVGAAQGTLDIGSGPTPAKIVADAAARKGTAIPGVVFSRQRPSGVGVRRRDRLSHCASKGPKGADTSRTAPPAPDRIRTADRVRHSLRARHGRPLDCGSDMLATSRMMGSRLSAITHTSSPPIECDPRDSFAWAWAASQSILSDRSRAVSVGSRSHSLSHDPACPGK